MRTKDDWMNCIVFILVIPVVFIIVAPVLLAYLVKRIIEWLIKELKNDKNDNEPAAP